MVRNAVFVGRFAVVTRAHMVSVATILRSWPSVVVGVLDVEADHQPPVELMARYSEFYRLCARNCATRRNPFTAAERVQLWNAALRHAGLTSRARATAMVRPEMAPAEFNEAYPADRYDLVTIKPGPDCDRFDQIRTACFEGILGRDLVEIEPPMIEHTSGLLIEVGRGRRDWGSFLAPGTVAQFAQLDGPARMQPRIRAQLHQAS